jgi:hypothetical protein
MDRVEIYAELSKRIRYMRLSDEHAIFAAYELALYEKLSALTDAVYGEMLTLDEAKHRLDAYIRSLHPKEGTIRI